LGAVWRLLRQHSSSAAVAGSVEAPALWQCGGSGGSFAAVWRLAWWQWQQLCGRVALAAAAAAAEVQQEAQWKCGSNGGGSVVVAAWQQLGRGCGRVGSVGGGTGG
jgi:hypothetical protein